MLPDAMVRVSNVAAGWKRRWSQLLVHEGERGRSTTTSLRARVPGAVSTMPSC